VAYFEQKKMLFSKIKTSVYESDSKSEVIAKIDPINLLDVNHHFLIKDKEGATLGKLEKKFITSKLWRTRYEFFDDKGNLAFYFLEENPWTRISNALLKTSKRTSLIPKYFFKPSYQILDKTDKLLGELVENKGLLKST
jgi:hypothetical protein